jgi:hypothetical protein
MKLFTLALAVYKHTHTHTHKTDFGSLFTLFSCLGNCFGYNQYLIREKSKLQIVIEKKRMGIMTYKKTFIFQSNIPTNLNTVSQVNGNQRRKILVVAVGTTRTLLNVCLRYSSALPRTSAPNYGPLDVTGNVHRTWAAFHCGYPLLPYLVPKKKIAQRHAVLSWYTPSCNSCSVFTVMRIPIVALHSKTR